MVHGVAKESDTTYQLNNNHSYTKGPGATPYCVWQMVGMVAVFTTWVEEEVTVYTAPSIASVLTELLAG